MLTQATLVQLVAVAEKTVWIKALCGVASAECFFVSTGQRAS
jgi:hypothetical protein